LKSFVGIFSGLAHLIFRTDPAGALRNSAGSDS